MALDQNYILLYQLQQYFVDKTTGAPLANGNLYFYSDINRNQLKNVYKYDSVNGYTVLPNPVPLSGVGTPTDGNGNDIAIYVFPFMDSSATSVENYFVRLTDSLGVTQITREGVPSFIKDTTSNEIDFTNYIPNGQFLLHNNVTATDTTPVGQITQAVTTIAPGGWTYEKESGSTSIDTVTFTRYGAYIDNPSGNPRYAVTITTTTEGVSKFRSLRLKFNDVNKFADPSQAYNLFFTAESNSGSSLSNFSISVIKNYGSDGSQSTSDLKQTITIPNSLMEFNIPIVFGTNANKDIGTLNDDYLQLDFAIPNQIASNITLTDFVLKPGDASITKFPTTTNAKFISDSLAGGLPVPDYDGQDLYLPIVRTPSGLGYSSADIGKIFSGIYATANIGEKFCDGSQYKYSLYDSTDGIPYRRLGNILWDSTLNLPIYGTGLNFVTTYNLSYASNKILLTTNQSGSASAVDVSVGGSGFTVFSIHPFSASNYGVRSFQFGADRIFLVGQIQGAVTPPSANTSGFTIGDIRNTTYSFHICNIDLVAASTFPTSGASAYFKFSNTTTTYYVWFQVGTSTDPAPGGTGIQINLTGSESVSDLAVILISALSGAQQAAISTVAASSIVGGAYFTFGATNSNNYYVWYKKDGVGSDPLLAAKIGIEVDIAGTDTAENVATKTIQEINRTYYAVPDFRGMFLRGHDQTGIWDIDISNRWSAVGGVYGARLGTFEFDEFLSHTHAFTYPSDANSIAYNRATVTNASFANSAGANLGLISQVPDISTTTGTESRGLNANVNFYIKY